MNKIRFVAMIAIILIIGAWYLYTEENKTGFNDFLSRFSSVSQIGIFVMTVGIGMIIHSTVSLFGYSKEEQRKIDDLKNKVVTSKATKKDKDEYLYYRLDRFQNIMIRYVFIVGMIVFFIGLIVH